MRILICRHEFIFASKYANLSLLDIYPHADFLFELDYPFALLANHACKMVIRHIEDQFGSGNLIIIIFQF
jgi:hypothetical protein